jgi:hypothetical protein
MSGLRSRDEFLAHDVMPSHPMPETDCSICTEPLESDVIKLIRCCHAFHTVCALSWFRGNRTGNRSCPNCRAELYEARPRPARAPASRVLMNPPLELDPPMHFEGELRLGARSPSRTRHFTLATPSSPPTPNWVRASPRTPAPVLVRSSHGDVVDTPAPSLPSLYDTPAGSSHGDMFETPAISSQDKFDTPAGTSTGLFDIPARRSDSLFDTPAGSLHNLFRGTHENRATASPQPTLISFRDLVPSSIPHNTVTRRARPRAPVEVSAATRLLWRGLG